MPLIGWPPLAATQEEDDLRLVEALHASLPELIFRYVSTDAHRMEWLEHLISASELHFASYRDLNTTLMRSPYPWDLKEADRPFGVVIGRRRPSNRASPPSRYRMLSTTYCRASQMPTSPMASFANQRDDSRLRCLLLQ
jgi:hypothetical protein